MSENQEKETKPTKKAVAITAEIYGHRTNFVVDKMLTEAQAEKVRAAISKVLGV